LYICLNLCLTIHGAVTGRVINKQFCLVQSGPVSLPLIKLGELGKGAGKGGGGGGAVREAGGAFGKKQAAEEEMYFK